jgi:general secretion pathway protein D
MTKEYKERGLTMMRRLVWLAICVTGFGFAGAWPIRAQAQAEDKSLVSEEMLIREAVSGKLKAEAKPADAEVPVRTATEEQVAAAGDLVVAAEVMKAAAPVGAKPAAVEVVADEPVVAAPEVDVSVLDLETAAPKKISVDGLNVEPAKPVENVGDSAVQVAPLDAAAPAAGKPPAEANVRGAAGNPTVAAVSGERVGSADAEVKPPVAVDVVRAEDLAAATPLPEGAGAIIDSELIIRKAHEEHAIATVKQAEREVRSGKFQEAVRLYEEAMRSIERAGEKAGNEIIRKKISDGLGESYYLWALLLIKERDFARAEQHARSAGLYWHPKAADLLAAIEKERVRPPKEVKIYPPARWNQDEYQKRQATIVDRLRFGKQYYLTGEYDKAELHFEAILKMDPENTEALRMMSKIAQKRSMAASAELGTTREAMVADVRRTWNPRDYGLLDDTSDMPLVSVGPTRKKDDETQRLSIQEKMEKIIVPEIDFRQANIYGVISFLQDASREFDKEEKDETKKGVNIVLNLAAGETGKAAAPEAPVDPFAAPAEGKTAGSDLPLVTFNARHISLFEALRIVTDVAKLQFRIEGSVVMVLPWNAPIGRIVTRMYDVLPTIGDKIGQTQGAATFGEGAGAATLPDRTGVGEVRADWKAFFESMGVPWPQGTSIRYVAAISKLIVANTTDNLHTFEKILAVLNVVPNQIEIEARFVEVRQTDLNALGLEWILTDNWEIAQKKGQEGIPADQRQRVSIDANNTGTERGFTKINRYLSSGIGLPGSVGVADDILRVSSMLTNPELSMILHAMEQRGNADLLSAPKVTTQSGSEATIKIVTEYIYPTAFAVTPITGTGPGGVATIVGGVVEPSGFETREVGVILTVMPEVTADGQMINLTMTPQVVDEPEWYEYGSEYTDADGRVQRLSMQQPFFKTRTVSTSLAIYNGATVVMGGMISENRNNIDDRIPFLGDVPLVGRLFRSKYERSEKRNLLIFVTARLVDPAGRPVMPQKDALTSTLRMGSEVAR